MNTRHIRVGTLLICTILALIALAPLATHAATTHPAENFQDTAVNAPGIADLTSFTAKVVNGKNIKVKWETGTEYSLLGFNLYRKLKNATTWEKLNQDLISPKTPGAIQGALYARTDKQLQMGKKYQYQLEMVGVYGNTAFSEIVTVKLK